MAQRADLIHVCCCLHCHRLRDLSAQDKLEHQRVVKDLEKNASELNQLKEDRDKIAKELQVRAAYVTLSAHNLS